MGIVGHHIDPNSVKLAHPALANAQPIPWRPLTPPVYNDGHREIGWCVCDDLCWPPHSTVRGRGGKVEINFSCPTGDVTKFAAGPYRRYLQRITSPIIGRVWWGEMLLQLVVLVMKFLSPEVCCSVFVEHRPGICWSGLTRYLIKC